jgi:hypothetical protein
MRPNDASSIRAQLNCAKVDVTMSLSLRKERDTHQVGSRAVSMRRSLALRLRLATDLPWTTFRVETIEVAS